MKEFLKGNYKVDTEIKETVDDERSQLETEFERKALSRLGGSICFVSKKSFIWNGDQAAQPQLQGEAQPAGRGEAEGEPSDQTSSRADTEIKGA